MGKQRKKVAARRAKEPGTVQVGLTPVSRPGDRRDRRGRGVPHRNPGQFDSPPHRPAGAAALARPARPLAPAVAEPRLLDASPLILPPRIGTIDEHFLRTELPALNNAVSDGALAVADFANVLQGHLAMADLEALLRIADRFSPMAALYILGALGTIASSAVRHVRVATGDNESNAGLELVPGLENALVRFGTVANRAPRDNHDTTWGLDFPMTFTATEGEMRFGRAVREANRLLGVSNALLMPVRTGEVDFVEAVDRFVEATGHVKAYTLIQSDLAFNAFSDDFFAMRKFLGAYVVAGKRLEGPNATYTGGWCSFELSVGLLDDFRTTAMHRTKFMSAEDRRHIETSCMLPTIAEIASMHLGVTEPSLETLDVEMLGKRLAATEPGMRHAIVAARGLMKANAQLAATHVGAIKKNLVMPASAMTDAERAHLGVSPDGGVSGTPLQVTFDQRTRRLLHPLVRMAVAGVKEDTK
ncbi:hypothetical protein BV97_01124 [Novosphingobium resinovorum]|uniref:Uncharacterized protein n=1 Tax=Novosphingobium resinovorum TaxID=158500 RepID=A0A031K1U8_9SPHN|nr:MULTISPECIES: hypothetical protein [Novosphingobium]EZP83931.1 hypothetical protein BV97_01124 [Novosphingobium resinovorum]